ncbi:MAG: DUF373 family protein [Nitrososphaerota archaeon]
MTEPPKKLLILVVDRDDDIGRKTGISTPIIGFEENLRAAQALLLADPEEADANAIFGALKVYRELSGRLGGDIEIATVAGREGEDLEADMKIMSELEEVLKRFKAEACVLVSDGVTDQFVTPIITSKLPIISVRRVVVRHSEAVEQTWLVLGRYLKLIFTEPRYSKIFLGIPGLLMAIIGILYILNVASLPFVLSAIGIYFIIRGFGLDQKVASSFRNAHKGLRLGSEGCLELQECDEALQDASLRSAKSLRGLHVSAPPPDGILHRLHLDSESRTRGLSRGPRVLDSCSLVA